MNLLGAGVGQLLHEPYADPGEAAAEERLEALVGVAHGLRGGAGEAGGGAATMASVMESKLDSSFPAVAWRRQLSATAAVLTMGESKSNGPTVVGIGDGEATRAQAGSCRFATHGP
jgi:hypothetical protein